MYRNIFTWNLVSELNIRLMEINTVCAKQSDCWEKYTAQKLLLYESIILVVASHLLL